ncbi:MAG: hypothetical protein ACYC5M_16780 [Anaerolineae bacterium]
MPALEPTEHWKPPRLAKAQMRPERERSPIWLALSFALVAFALAYWVHRPTLPDVNWPDLLLRMMVSEDSSTPAPGGEAEPSLLPAPQPEAPEDDELITGDAVTIIWSWDRPLAEDEAFDLRLAGHVGDPQSVGIVRAYDLVVPLAEDGTYTWQVTVVRIEDGAVIEAVSESSSPVRFELQVP